MPSITPLVLPGPTDPAQRVEGYRASLRRLAPFTAAAVVLLTGPGERGIIVDGLRSIAEEARPVGLTIGLEPCEEESGSDWTIVSTVRDAVELIEEAHAADAVGILFDLWHLWDDAGLEDDLEIFSDNGALGSAYPDSLWDVPAAELARRGRQRFLDCWARRS